MTDYTAKIRAKGLDATGITEEIARQMHSNRGRHYMAIVELEVDETHDKKDGTHKVDLVLTQVEPATSEDLAEHLRELTRTLYYNRGLDGHTGTTTSGQERTVEDVLASGAGHKPHPFLPAYTADDNDNPICDVCGLIQATGVHSTQDVLDEPDDEDEPDADNELDGPHAYDAGPDDVCQCGLPFEDDIHAPHGADEQEEEQEEEPDGADVERWETTTPPEVYNTVPNPFEPTVPA